MICGQITGIGCCVMTQFIHTAKNTDHDSESTAQNNDTAFAIDACPRAVNFLPGFTRIEAKLKKEKNKNNSDSAMTGCKKATFLFQKISNSPDPEK